MKYRTEVNCRDLSQIIDDTPHLASDLKCGGRDGLRGRQFTDLRGKHITDVPNERVLPCNQHDDVRKYKEGRQGVR